MKLVEKPRRGAVRSEASRTAILTATAQLFASRGYDHLSIEGIAAEAGVGKQTVYRWWHSKGALVAECILEKLLLPDSFSPPTSGTLRADLTAWFADLLRFVGTPANDSLLRSFLVAAVENTDVAERLTNSLGASSALRNRLIQGIEANELPSGAPIVAISDSLVGAIVLLVLTRQATDPARAGEFVAAVIGTHA
jgi:AcrR family transcriptional regulator